MLAFSLSYGTSTFANQFNQDEEFMWFTSILTGVVMCKIVYEATNQVSSLNFKVYPKLTRAESIEWNSRGISTCHALIAAVVTFYLLFLSDLFQEGSYLEPVIDRKSVVCEAIIGFSAGYFLSDMAMILWHFPALGGMEYVLHHGLSLYAIILSLGSGKAQIYILLVLFTEITTPLVNMRWYLDVAGQKSSKIYMINGILLFFGWLVARVLLFVYFFTHMFLHFDQVRTIFTLGFYSLLVVSPLMGLMNLFWFWKIFKGLKKALCKGRRRH